MARIKKAEKIAPHNWIKKSHERLFCQINFDKKIERIDETASVENRLVRPLGIEETEF